MSFDLYREEVDNRLSSMRPVTQVEPGVFDNFFAGTGKMAMQTFAKAGRAASMAAAPLAMALESSPDSTVLQDKFFKAHDEIFGSAVDSWTPKPGEVGEAGQVVGQLLGTLPLVMASPAATVAMTQLSTGEDLVRKGVDAGTAQAVGGVQAAGLGLGIWVPILGQTLAQRVLLGGAGFNVAQGLATRAASAELLEGTPGAEDFKALDPTALTLDVLLGAAFGGIAHINPRMRAEGDAWHAKLKEWGAKLKPSEVDALATLRQAQHLNADSLPGKPVDVEDVNAHVERMRQALDDLANDRPVSVEDMPAGRFEADEARAAEAEQVMRILFHGSPFSFDKFDITKIGTGEGAQAYGRGLYFAENPDVAKAYSEDIVNIIYKGRPYDIYIKQLGDDTDSALFNALWKIFGEDEKKAQVARKVIDENPRNANEYLKILLEKNKNSGYTDAIKDMMENTVFPSKSFYKVEVPESVIEKMLDWDKPFSKQSPVVREMLTANKYFHPPKNDSPIGEWIAKLRKEGDPEITFKEIGITGIKYLDSGSRNAGEGTRNYVLFDDSIPKIIERNGEIVGTGRTTRQADTEAAGLDPLASEASRFASENPDLPIIVGKNADGSDITTTPRQWLDDADATMRQAQEDARLFEIAAGCLLGGGR